MLSTSAVRVLLKLQLNRMKFPRVALEQSHSSNSSTHELSLDQKTDSFDDDDDDDDDKVDLGQDSDDVRFQFRKISIQPLRTSSSLWSQHHGRWIFGES